MVVGRWKAKGGKKYTLKKKWMLKTITEKLKRNRIMTGMLIWLNRSIVTINVTFQLLYIYIYIYICKDQIWLGPRTETDLGPKSPNNKFVESGRKS